MKNGAAPICASAFDRSHLRKAAIAAGVQIPDGHRLALHNLRHSLSKWLVNQAKVDPKTAQEIASALERADDPRPVHPGDNDNKISAQDKFWGLIVDQSSSSETTATT